MIQKFSQDINKDFFEEFYGLSESQLLELEQQCSAYKISWTDLFYCPTIIQEGKISIIAEKHRCLPSELWEYRLIWMPSDDELTTKHALSKVQNDKDIMGILNQSKEFRIP